MIITVELPENQPGKHRIKFNGTDINGNFFVHRHTFGAFKLVVYYDTNRYVEIDFLNCTVKFDISVGYDFTISHYSHFTRDNIYIFQCQEVDLFNPLPHIDEEDI